MENGIGKSMISKKKGIGSGDEKGMGSENGIGKSMISKKKGMGSGDEKGMGSDEHVKR